MVWALAAATRPSSSAAASKARCCCCAIVVDSGLLAGPAVCLNDGTHRSSCSHKRERTPHNSKRRGWRLVACSGVWAARQKRERWSCALPVGCVKALWNQWDFIDSMYLNAREFARCVLLGRLWHPGDPLFFGCSVGASSTFL